MILVTGGAGYIGSHTCVELLNAGYDVVVVDNLYNSSEKALERVEQITGKTVKFYEADLLDKASLKTVFDREHIDAVIHFAGYKAVGESVEKPLEYYENNIGSTLNLCNAMREHGVKRLIFSSSATVYGEQPIMPITEAMEKKPATNPYGWTKWMIEEILRSVCNADPDWSVVLLRYFNPIGAHESGLIGEDPKGIPNNLVPYVAQTAVGKREFVHVYGKDYETPDGTGVRDYIHVVDLAKGHLAAMKKVLSGSGVHVYNLGTGRGYSVLEVIEAFSKACGKQIPYRIEDRRPGDIAYCYSDPAKALAELGWKAEKDMDAMCRDSYRWQTMNPNGYNEE
ncbi:MAG: UDP-glucose 4-epimerase GalE [Lachnospiraceae bacterium]|nr:UDP-glucose 4-epimerase GalE [Lachnospiraceae bacterium]